MKIELCVRGEVSGIQVNNFDGLELRFSKDRNSILTGELPDQSALFGLLRRVQSLGMQLISLQVLEEDRNEST